MLERKLWKKKKQKNVDTIQLFNRCDKPLISVSRICSLQSAVFHVVAGAVSAEETQSET